MNSSFVMENDRFLITLDPATGGVTGITLKDDPHAMNWAEGQSQWGTMAPIRGAVHVTSDNFDSRKDGYAFQSVLPEENALTAIYESNLVRVTVRREFSPNGLYRERYTLTNPTKVPVFLPRGTFGIFTTFNDNYQDVGTCLTRRCHTHIWCGEESSWVCALRMSGQAPHLGLVLTEGSLSGYSVIRRTELSSNDRGDFILCPGDLVLESGESTSLCWELFPHQGKEDFRKKLMDYPHTIAIKAQHYTLFPGENLVFTATAPKIIETASVTVDGTALPFTVDGSTLSVDTSVPHASPAAELPVVVTINGVTTHLTVIFRPALPELRAQRVRYICQNQQYKKKGSPLTGSCLIYDTVTHHQYYNAQFADHNAARERVAMGVMMAVQLQRQYDEAIYASLMDYLDFVSREIFSPEDGTVYNDVRHDNSWHRLYNYPLIADLFLETYRVTGDKDYLRRMALCMKAYYRNGGARFYALVIPLADSVLTLRQAGMDKLAGELLALYRSHGDGILKNSIFFPAHEVAYEQSIVTPAIAILLQLYELTHEARYWEEIQRQMPLLEAFSFTQPDAHLHEISIRHWDGYWFGKRMQYGDTFPHYWSTLTADVFVRYGRLSGEPEYLRRAEEILRGNLCLFFPDGSASCAYLYPIEVNATPCEYYDEWANDQDWALYFADKWLPQL